jgi:hypothetical protein
MGRWLLQIICGIIGLAGTMSGLPAQAAEPDDIFERHIAPLLEARCVACHRGITARAHLSLETRAQAVRGGDSGAAIVAGAPDESLLLDMISGDAPDMPKDAPALSADEIAQIRAWIEAGAPWPENRILQADPAGAAHWWSLASVTRPVVPATTDAWVRNPIDVFILAKLGEQGLTPSTQADRRTLIRRLTYDLHGLPPTREEIAEFLADERPDAYEHLVDRLLASPRYGERWARHWLDVVHYGDTHGYDKDKRRDHAWHYRDWVIDALNRDLPYGQFVREQLAGDVLYPDTVEGLAAAGFIAAGPWDFVGHVELGEETLEKQKTRWIDRDDMVTNAMSTFASLTVHCARCHDHPFDPISQGEYYQLQAVFAGVDRGNRDCELPKTRALRETLTARRTALEKDQAEVRATIAAVSSPELERLVAEQKRIVVELAELSRDLLDHESLAASPSNGYHSAIADKPNAVKWVQVDLGQALPLDLVRLIPARPTDFADTPGFGFPSRYRLEVSLDPNFEQPLLLLEAQDTDQPNPGELSVLWQGSRVVARYVRLTATQLWQRTGDYVFALAEMQVESIGQNVAAGRAVSALDSIEGGRWGTGNLVDGFASRRHLPAFLDPAIAAREQQALNLRQQLQTIDQERAELAERLVPDELHSKEREIAQQLADVSEQLEQLPAPTQVYTVVPRAARPIHLYPRGNVEQPGEKTGPGVLSAVTQCAAWISPEANEGVRRLALADWLADSQHPLTWRSIVNRVWQFHFGRGLIDTPSDFGRNGSRPTHPELLDWLASEFLAQGQSLKALHRLIVRSATYQQASNSREGPATLDGDNRWLWRANSQRLEAEALRDAVLLVAGQLNTKPGGPGFELFAFEDDHSPRYKYVALDKPEVNRRTIYRFIVRSVPPPFLETLDCPDPSLNTPVRGNTITALQALALLNNPFMVRQAGYLAARAEQAAPEPAERIDWLIETLLSRLPEKEERQELLAYAQEHGWAALCRVLLNTNEFMFVD